MLLSGAARTLAKGVAERCCSDVGNVARRGATLGERLFGTEGAIAKKCGNPCRGCARRRANAKKDDGEDETEDTSQQGLLARVKSSARWFEGRGARKGGKVDPFAGREVADYVRSLLSPTSGAVDSAANREFTFFVRPRLKFMGVFTPVIAWIPGMQKRRLRYAVIGHSWGARQLLFDDPGDEAARQARFPDDVSGSTTENALTVLLSPPEPRGPPDYMMSDATISARKISSLLSVTGEDDYAHCRPLNGEILKAWAWQGRKNIFSSGYAVEEVSLPSSREQKNDSERRRTLTSSSSATLKGRSAEMVTSLLRTWQGKKDHTVEDVLNAAGADPFRVSVVASKMLHNAASPEVCELVWRLHDSPLLPTSIRRSLASFMTVKLGSKDYDCRIIGESGEDVQKQARANTRYLTDLVVAALDAVFVAGASDANFAKKALGEKLLDVHHVNKLHAVVRSASSGEESGVRSSYHSEWYLRRG